jgi:hypothetical protein
MISPQFITYNCTFTTQLLQLTADLPQAHSLQFAANKPLGCNDSPNN